MTLLPVRSNTALQQKAQPLPSEVSPKLYGNYNHPALFSFYTGDIISMVADSPSPFSEWLPARAVTNWNEPIAHLSWVAPEDFTGEDTYADYLAAKDPVEECDFGDGFTYQICEYMHTMARMAWSTKSEPIKVEDLGMKLFERMPQQVLRGDSVGVNINNDRDWSIARLGIGIQDHQNWNMIYGDERVYSNTYLGINNIVTAGWVRNRNTSRGTCDFTDPIVVSGVDLENNQEILRMMKAIARRLIRRMSQRGYTPRGDDMAWLMNDTMWDMLSETIAWGVMDVFNPPSGFQLQTTPEVVSRELQRVRTGGVGYGSIRVGTYDIPVLPETRIGHGTTNSDGLPSVTGDIFILTKRYKGFNILEHQYVNWNSLGKSPMQDLTGFKNGEYKPQIFQNGMIRVSVQTLNGNNLCWYYGADMYGRITTYMSALQGRLNDVTVITYMEGDNESASFTSPDFFAFDGEQAGSGDVLLVGLNQLTA